MDVTPNASMCVDGGAATLPQQLLSSQQQQQQGALAQPQQPPGQPDGALASQTVTPPTALTALGSAGGAGGGLFGGRSGRHTPVSGLRVQIPGSGSEPAVSASTAALVITPGPQVSTPSEGAG